MTFCSCGSITRIILNWQTIIGLTIFHSFVHCQPLFCELHFLCYILIKFINRQPFSLFLFAFVQFFSCFFCTLDIFFYPKFLTYSFSTHHWYSYDFTSIYLLFIKIVLIHFLCKLYTVFSNYWKGFLFTNK